MFLSIQDCIINSDNIINISYGGFGANHSHIKPIIIRYQIDILLKICETTKNLCFKYSLDDKEKYDKDVKYLMEKLCYN